MCFSSLKGNLDPNPTAQPIHLVASSDSHPNALRPPRRTASYVKPAYSDRETPAARTYSRSGSKPAYTDELVRRARAPNPDMKSVGGAKAVVGGGKVPMGLRPRIKNWGEEGNGVGGVKEGGGFWKRKGGMGAQPSFI